MKISQERSSANDDLHQIEIKDQRSNNEIGSKTEACIGYQPYTFFRKKSTNKSKFKKKKYFNNEQNKNTIIDVLYENQRGGSFCGTMMFSSNSLLFFDPSPWTDKNFRSSPVNTTTATCPGPSWKWTWDKWKIDMCENVDAEGWSYSFSFWSKKWYGTCIWFHSFVRRRKWIRERQWKCIDDPDIMDNDNYFTVNSSYKLSRSPSTSTLNESIASSKNFKTETDIQNLLKKLKEYRIDRERLHVLESFILSSNQNINLLNDSIKDVLDCFIFQESRRQFLTFLIKTIESIEMQSQSISNDLQETINFIKKEKYKYDFWEDKQETEKNETAGFI
ncbi:hypothetical protein PMAC_002167 [Pneumocystis sp. 'macacae']|nr:hypothetical protein PMAC_002167 [Pneumocystis sp. 'macacae']